MLTLSRLQKQLNTHGTGLIVLDQQETAQTISYKCLPTHVAYQSLTAKQKDLASSLALTDLLTISQRHGSNAVYVDVPNPNRQTIKFELAPAKDFSFIVGVDAKGERITTSLIDSQAPHMLIAGGTGSGKSTAINCILTTIVSNYSPELARLILINPKGVELIDYSDTPHCIKFLGVEATSNKCQEAIKVLDALALHMDKRYQLMSQARVKHAKDLGLPYIFCVIDEFADLSTQASKAFEDVVKRLVAKARACGIHLILATQHPSAEVIGTLIKTNVKQRLGFSTSSIQGSMAMELEALHTLLGKGDAKFKSASQQEIRLQAPFISEQDIKDYVAKSEAKYKDYDDHFMAKYKQDFDTSDDSQASGLNTQPSLKVVDNQELIEQAIALAESKGELSAATLKRELNIGYKSAPQILQALVDMNVLQPVQGKAHQYVGGEVSGQAAA